MVRPGRVQLGAAVGSSPVVVPGVLGQDAAQVAFAEDQHLVGDFGPGGEREPFRISIRARDPGRDRHRFDADAGQGRIERCGELPGAVADQEPEAGGAVTEIDQEMTDLPGGPRPVRVRGDPENVQVAAASFDDEQAVQAPEGDGAVHVEEAGRGRRRRVGRARIRAR